MAMLIYVRPWPTMPPCKHCGKLMDHWVPGLAWEDHCHAGCAGEAAANVAIEKFKLVEANPSASWAPQEPFRFPPNSAPTRDYWKGRHPAQTSTVCWVTTD